MTTIFDVIGEQKALSGVQDWAAAQAAQGNLPQSMADLAQADPRSFRALIPSIIQQQAGQSAVASLSGGGQPQAQPQQALAQLPDQSGYGGSSGDSSPNLPVPQTLPGQGGGSALSQIAQPAQTSAVAPTQQNPLSSLAALTRANGGDIGKAVSTLSALKGLAVPAGAGAAPEGMRYDPNNPGTLIRIPGSVSKGQSDVDAPFAASWETYNNAGGATRTQDAITKVQGVIDQLKSGDITTGGPVDALSMAHGEPTETGQLLNRKLLAARNTVSSAVLPLAKPLFGSRVTNFDAQSLVNSQGLDPLQSTDANITKLEQLKNSISAGQKDIESSGAYFSQHGTLAGYQKPSALAQISPQLATQTAPVAASPTALAQVSQQAQSAAPKIYVNPQKDSASRNRMVNGFRCNEP